MSFEIEDLSGACDSPSAEEPLAGYTYAFIDRTKKPKNCAITDCTSAVNATGKCDPKIFISWIGTDRDGNTLISASNKLTNFYKYNMAGMFESILNVNTNNNADPDTPIRYDSTQVDADVITRITNHQLMYEQETGENAETNTPEGTTGIETSENVIATTSKTQNGVLGGNGSR